MESKLFGTDGRPCYGAILGANPSKAARSPLLWNAVFHAFQIDAVFGAYDVVESELGRVVAGLKADPAFIGGAVAVPYKSAILPFLDEVEPECERIGAANALYRKNGRLVGSNTDGKGALACLLNFVKDPHWLSGKSVLLLGTGGAGKAVATYLAMSCGSKGLLRLCNRTLSRAEELARELKSYGGMAEPVALSALEKVLRETDLVVNCTSVGAVDTPHEGVERLLNVLSTPLAPIQGRLDCVDRVAAAAACGSENMKQSLLLLGRLPERAVVFDIVYRPLVTMLLKLSEALGRRTVGGLGMNLEQAVMACHNALSRSSLWRSGWSVDAIREVMARVS